MHHTNYPKKYQCFVDKWTNIFHRHAICHVSESTWKKENVQCQASLARLVVRRSHNLEASVEFDLRSVVVLAVVQKFLSKFYFIFNKIMNISNYKFSRKMYGPKFLKTFKKFKGRRYQKRSKFWIAFCVVIRFANLVPLFK